VSCTSRLIVNTKNVEKVDLVERIPKKRIPKVVLFDFD
jgi:hypothetical protein